MKSLLHIGLTTRACPVKLPDRREVLAPPDKRCVISSLLCVGAITAGSALQPGSALGANSDASKMNIILCMTDDQGWGDVGYNGHSVLKIRKDEQASYELYDLASDPLEKTNLAETHPKVLAEMIATLEDWR